MFDNRVLIMADLEGLRKQLIKSAKESVRREFSGSDVHAFNAVNLLDDLDRVFNLMAEHCIEWHAVHFPELKELVSDNELILRLIAELGGRENFGQETVEAIVGDDELAGEISKAVNSSMGSKISEKDLKQVSTLAVNALRVKDQRKALEDYVDDLMLQTAPNLSQVAGSLLAARLIARAGSLRQLALMPSSAVQLLGAEKALFRHLRSKRKALPPKHGLIFQHSLIQQLKTWQRGSMARALAGKISIAARKDFFNMKENISGELQNGLQERFEKLEKKKEPARKPSVERFSRENPMRRPFRNFASFKKRKK